MASACGDRGAIGGGCTERVGGLVGGDEREEARGEERGEKTGAVRYEVGREDAVGENTGEASPWGDIECALGDIGSEPLLGDMGVALGAPREARPPRAGRKCLCEPGKAGPFVNGAHTLWAGLVSVLS